MSEKPDRCAESVRSMPFKSPQVERDAFYSD
jgi:hypothetical protein